MSDHLISIVIATYNEASNIPELFRRIKEALNGYRYEIIIVDDSSPDGTAEIARRKMIEYGIDGRVIIRSERGLSSAILRGFRESRGDIIVVMDADLQHPPEVIPRLIEYMESRDLDIVIASRYIRGGGIESWSLYRRAISKLASFIARVLIPQIRGIKDPMSGFFALRRRVVDGIDMRPRGFKILLEIIVRGRWRRISEYPYIFGSRKQGRSKLRLRDMSSFILQVLDLSEYRLLKFMITGATGVAVNNIVLYLLVSFGIPVYIASPIAIEIATINNFTINNLWTFTRFRRYGKWYSRLAKYHVAVGLGNAINYITVLLLNQYIGLIESNLLGIFLGFIANYLVSSEFVWEIKWASIEKSKDKKYLSTSIVCRSL